MSAKRYPLNKRFSAALSDEAYINLRKLNETYHLSNNYILTVLLENLDKIIDLKKMDDVFQEFVAEYGAPKPAKPNKSN